MISLDDIIGQDAALQRLRAYLGSNRIPHAFLFAGPDGVGRETTARALAVVLLCEAPAQGNSSPVACEQCESCRLMKAGTHPDFHLVFKELARYHEDASVRDRKMQSLGIGVIQQFLLGPAGRASSKKRGKVFLLREADLMTREAQNALLKTLEEPPAGVTLILLTDRPDMLLPTTRSRCALVRFGPLPADFVLTQLLKDGLGEDEARFWANFTDGSLGEARQMAGFEIFPIKHAVVSRLAALVTRGDAELGQDLAKHTDQLAELEIRQVKKDEDAEMAKTLAVRRAAATMLRIIGSAYRDALRLATGADATIIHADQSDAIVAVADHFSPTQLAEILEQLSDYEQLLWRNANAKVLWDNVAISCATAEPLFVAGQ